MQACSPRILKRSELYLFCELTDFRKAQYFRLERVVVVCDSSVAVTARCFGIFCSTLRCQNRNAELEEIVGWDNFLYHKLLPRAEIVDVRKVTTTMHL